MRGRALALIWNAMRKAETFDIAEIGDAVGCDHTTVSKYLKMLIKEGFVKQVQKRINGIKSRDRYQIIRTDIIMPDVNGKETPEGAQDKMWRSMRIFGSFTAAEIAGTSYVHIDTAARYINRLKDVGYVKVLKSNNGGGNSGDYNVYRLIKNTGVRCPQVCSDGKVYDCNINQYVEAQNV
jgi:Fic family protein